MIHPWHQNPWLRRLMFLSANLAVGFAITIACILPVRDFFADRDSQIVQQRMTLSRLRAIAGHETAVMSAAGQTAADRGEFLAGRNEGVINADLQSRLKNMVEAAGARLRSVRTLQPPGDEQASYIGSRLELFGTLPAIHRAVHAIESVKPYLFIRGAVIRPSPMAGRPGAPQEPIIDAQLDVFGALRVEVRDR